MLSGNSLSAMLTSTNKVQSLALHIITCRALAGGALICSLRVYFSLIVIVKRCASFHKKMIAPAFRTLTRVARSSVSHLQKVMRRNLSASVEEGKYVIVQRHKSCDNATMKFPSVWLRDNCCCEQCFHQSSKSRRINWDHFDTEVMALDVQVSLILMLIYTR